MSIFSQSFPPKARWTAADIPDLSGEIAIVTGGNSGIGKETVKALLTRNAKVYMASRNQTRAQQAIDELRTITGGEAVFLKLDLASLESIKTSADEFCSGVMIPPIEDLTVDGFDLQFGVNVLGHFYFTELLLPTLMATAESSKAHVRVVHTSSLGHMFTPLNYKAFRDGPERIKMGRQELYQMSKYGITVLSADLARRYGKNEIVSIAVNPRNINTDLNRNAGIVQKTLSRMLFYTAEMGAVTQLYAGTAPEADQLNGQYLIPWARVGEARSDAIDSRTGEELWKWLEEQVASVIYGHSI